MIEFLRNWVVNIVTLVIFIILLEILIPSGKIKKYINLATGFVLLIAIINPFLGLFKNGIDLKEFHVTSSNFIDKKEIEQSSKVLKEKQIKQIIETYRRKIIRQVEESLNGIEGSEGAAVDVIINEDYQSEHFGEIKRVYVNLKPAGEKEEIKPVTKIERVDIGKGKQKPQNNTEDHGKEVKAEIRTMIENKINKLLDVQKENIVVTLQPN